MKTVTTFLLLMAASSASAGIVGTDGSPLQPTLSVQLKSAFHGGTSENPV